MVPEVGCSKPDRILRRGDLPAPFSPMMACTSPGLTSKSTLNSTGISPNDLEILFADRIGGTAVPSALVMRISLPVDAPRFAPRSSSWGQCKGFLTDVKVYTTPERYRFVETSGLM